jgi:hypothetical protein
MKLGSNTSVNTRWIQNTGNMAHHTHKHTRIQRNIFVETFILYNTRHVVVINQNQIDGSIVNRRVVDIKLKRKAPDSLFNTLPVQSHSPK